MSPSHHHHAPSVADRRQAAAGTLGAIGLVLALGLTGSLDEAWGAVLLGLGTFLCILLTLTSGVGSYALVLLGTVPAQLMGFLLAGSPGLVVATVCGLGILPGLSRYERRRYFS